ncbi:MAG: ATP-dependent zinc metalloprotease FtsH [Lachnospiraceae bacterium]|uniref:ATP-dependent zinc metalloprotease FtsH n=1 Tax=Agathobacter sp. TaxID=2021311 RepID=UPI0029438D67|nr:ATP-dependent zinc metalloprotease FtsH [uncultured Agathobacter sp.]MCI7113209.1 ATP-dependent zinc metalloprotease FtsH [Lachnobacterium sp.]MDD6137809.1 ATP-dependent zinc metalloprotease FtsH [Lachnospiraceae bacterium]MDY6156526.1 ATP-dependent zinc metalloprotease FtsH [Agathobacter sp.]MEE1034258.1 ATP-dependent zinc metalloprotease FtsH [Agathobacter sp.]
MRGIGAYVIIVIAIVCIWYWLSEGSTSNSYTQQQFEKDLSADKIENVKVIQNREVPTGSLEVSYKDGSSSVLYVTDVNDIENTMTDAGYTDYTVADVPAENWIMTLLPYLLVFGAVFILFVIMSNNAASQNGGGKMMNFGKNRARLTTQEDNHVKFDNVAGLKEEKEEIEEIVDFLKAPGKYTKLGARIPKGVLLVGPPGTGKTLLAKAVAGEAGVPFFTISGSDFVEMFVGVGASRVRDLFEDAKKNAPCIVFIDEIDAVARRRGTGMGGGHDEREQTLNQMLVEMDGFGVNEGIIVMAATNRVDILDPAIMRPGRFDRKIVVGRPDVGGREEILNVHAKAKPLAEDVDLKQVAQTTAGFTGADLENLLNEAAIHAAKENREYITQDDIKKSFVKVGIGAEKKSRIISDKEKRITAYHESGHALLFHLLPDVGPVYTVSIIPTGVGAAGYTMPLPERDEMFNTKGRMLQEIIVDLGGRVAEELVFDDITTGASQDIKQATKLAREMVTKYGMSENIGLICYADDDEEVFIGRDLAHTKSYSEGIASAIDAEVKSIIDDAYEKAKKMIDEHRDILDKCASLLLEKEKISKDEFEALFND